MPGYPLGTPEHPATDPGRRRDGPGRATARDLADPPGRIFQFSPEGPLGTSRLGGSARATVDIGFRVVRTLPPAKTPADR